eukprot:3172061-Rhodomonas_salina.1
MSAYSITLTHLHVQHHISAPFTTSQLSASDVNFRRHSHTSPLPASHVNLQHAALQVRRRRWRARAGQSPLEQWAEALWAYAAPDRRHPTVAPLHPTYTLPTPYLHPTYTLPTPYPLHSTS